MGSSFSPMIVLENTESAPITSASCAVNPSASAAAVPAAANPSELQRVTTVASRIIRASFCGCRLRPSRYSRKMIPTSPIPCAVVASSTRPSPHGPTSAPSAMYATSMDWRANSASPAMIAAPVKTTKIVKRMASPCTGPPGREEGRVRPSGRAVVRIRRCGRGLPGAPPHIAEARRCCIRPRASRARARPHACRRPP